MTSAIQGKWPAPQASEQTLEAERGLGIGGTPYYFYVLRAEENFGLVVFVLSEVKDLVWPSDAMGATPFDSGGLWSGKVATHPALKEAERRFFFQDQDVPLVDWRAAFEQYVRTHYGTVFNYLEGNAPRPGSKPRDSGVTIVKGNPNDKRAWTWEVRIPHNLAAGRLELRATYMKENHRKSYLDWLPHSSLTEHESSRIYRWVEDNVVVPTEDESVAQAAEDRMAMEVADV